MQNAECRMNEKKFCILHSALNSAPRDPGYIPLQRNLGELTFGPSHSRNKFVVFTRQTNSSPER